MNRKLITVSFVFALGLANVAHAATTLSISACDNSGVTFTYSTTEESASVIASVTSGEEAFVELTGTSGTVTTDFAENWGGSDNSNVSLQLFGGNETATASCP